MASQYNACDQYVKRTCGSTHAFSAKPQRWRFHTSPTSGPILHSIPSKAVEDDRHQPRKLGRPVTIPNPLGRGGRCVASWPAFMSIYKYIMHYIELVCLGASPPWPKSCGLHVGWWVHSIVRRQFCSCRVCEAVFLARVLRTEGQRMVGEGRQYAE